MPGGDYTDLLKQHQITISMSRKANPYDNAQAESFMKTLKYEEVHRQEYRSMAEALASIGEFIDQIYFKNGFIRRWDTGRRRNLSEMLVKELRWRKNEGALGCVFLRHGEIHQSDVVIL